VSLIPSSKGAAGLGESFGVQSVAMAVNLCPFHSLGRMGKSARSYVARSSDGEIRRAAESDTFIWVQGEFQYGRQAS
jgi:hypothetical protein